MTPEKLKNSSTPAVDHLIPRMSQPMSNDAMAQKVIEDIYFLRDRIERIKRLQTPNSTVLKTYQSMLESREAVLAWLRENTDVDMEDTFMGMRTNG
jgi:hypothetical protein